jgi:predicted ester cyclase
MAVDVNFYQNVLPYKNDKIGTDPYKKYLLVMHSDFLDFSFGF